MNKQKQKDLCNFQLDHAPKWKKPFNWQSMAILVALFAIAVAVSIVIGCNLTWSDFCG